MSIRHYGFSVAGRRSAQARQVHRQIWLVCRRQGVRAGKGPYLLGRGIQRHCFQRYRFRVFAHGLRGLPGIERYPPGWPTGQGRWLLRRYRQRRRQGLLGVVLQGSVSRALRWRQQMDRRNRQVRRYYRREPFPGRYHGPDFIRLRNLDERHLAAALSIFNPRHRRNPMNGKTWMTAVALFAASLFFGPAQAQTTSIKTEYLMTYVALLDPP